MKGKKLISLLCAGAMTASLLAGCGSSSESADSSAASESEKSTETTAEADSTDSAASDGDTMTIEIFDVAANYQGYRQDGLQRLLRIVSTLN